MQGVLAAVREAIRGAVIERLMGGRGELAQRACLSLLEAPRDRDWAVLDAPQSSEISREAYYVTIFNLGPGLALDISYDFVELSRCTGSRPIAYGGHLPRLQAGACFETPLARHLLRARTLRFRAAYRDGNGKRYGSAVTIEKGIVKQSKLGRRLGLWQRLVRRVKVLAAAN